MIRGGGRWVDWSGDVPCAPDPGFVVTYHLTGTVQGETATFTTCNDGGYDAEGTVRFADDTLAGSATCRVNRGDSAGSTDMQVLIP